VLRTVVVYSHRRIRKGPAVFFGEAGRGGEERREAVLIFVLLPVVVL
jgi:hypothetical protein